MSSFRLSPVVAFVAGAAASFVFFACGGDGDSRDAAPGSRGPLRVLARNVLLRTSPRALSVRRASAETQVDTTTKVEAGNVVFATNVSADILATDVQAALEELAVKLDAALPGEWSIENQNQEDLHAPTGLLRVNADGTFELKSGSFAAIGMGSDGFCSHQAAGQTYRLISSRVALFKHTNDTTVNSAIPTLIEAKPNRLVFIGQGGCGSFGVSRVSILTRIGANRSGQPVGATSPEAGAPPPSGQP